MSVLPEADSAQRLSESGSPRIVSIMSGQLQRHAERYDARIELNGSILVPARRLSAFLVSAAAETIAVPYIECLFFSAMGVRPSMMLSGTPSDFPDHAAFLAFASEASESAIAEAEAEGAAAFFEVGP